MRYTKNLNMKQWDVKVHNFLLDDNWIFFYIQTIQIVNAVLQRNDRFYIITIKIQFRHAIEFVSKRRDIGDVIVTETQMPNIIYRT